jgi:hypothetical protein
MFFTLTYILFYVHVLCILNLYFALHFVCNVKKISPSETKFFIYAFTVMAYIFSLFYVLTVVYNGGGCFDFKNIHHCKLLWVCDYLCDIILAEIWSLSRMVLTLKCVFILIIYVTRNCARYCLLSLFESQNRKHYTERVEKVCSINP